MERLRRLHSTARRLPPALPSPAPASTGYPHQRCLQQAASRPRAVRRPAEEGLLTEWHSLVVGAGYHRPGMVHVEVVPQLVGNGLQMCRLFKTGQVSQQVGSQLGSAPWQAATCSKMPAAGRWDSTALLEAAVARSATAPGRCPNSRRRSRRGRGRCHRSPGRRVPQMCKCPGAPSTPCW